MSGTSAGSILWALLLLTSCSSSQTSPTTGSNGGSNGGGVSIGGESSQGGAQSSAPQSSTCETGTETCACFANDICFAGLTCASHLCVRLNTGGASAAAGSIGIGGGLTLAGTSAAGGASPAGGNAHTGGTTGGGLTGVLSSTGGVVGATGGATAILSPGDAILSWDGIPKDASTSSSIEVTLRPGAEPLSTAQITLTYCGAGWAGMISVDDLQLLVYRLQCPNSAASDDCANGVNYQLTTTVAVTGTEESCCYKLAFDSMTHLLHDGYAAMISLVVLFRRDGERYAGLDLAKTPTWTVYVDGQRSMSCTLASSTSTAPTCN